MGPVGGDEDRTSVLILSDILVPIPAARGAYMIEWWHAGLYHYNLKAANKQVSLGPSDLGIN